MNKITQALLALSLLSSANAISEEYRVIQLYTQDELNVLIKNNQHLQRVKADDCQLVDDIKAHALKVKEPSYTFLWGDMLAWGVCVDRDAKLGMHYIQEAAQQGLLAALEQLGRYYNKGILVFEDKNKALTYFREAALQGNLKAQISYISLLNQGYGSPHDYEDAYRVLYNNVIQDKKTKLRAKKLLVQLSKNMPGYVIERAQQINNE